MAGATVTKKYAYHGTADGTDVDKVTLTQPTDSYTFVNRGSNEIYVTVDGTAPTVGGDNTYVVPSGFICAIPIPQPATVRGEQPAGIQAQIISGESNAYSVEAF